MEGTPGEARRFVRFGPFEADLQSGDLRKQGFKIRLRGRPFDILALLLERPGEVVTRETLRERLWTADTFVDFDHGLNTSVNRLREGLGDTADNPKFVETLPRRGYRFIAPVEWLKARSSAEAPAPTAAPSPPEASPTDAPRMAGTGPAEKAGRRGAGRVLAVVVLLAGVGLALWLLRGRTRSARPLDQPRVAVLPFLNVSGESGQEYFADGMTDALIAELAQLDGLRVISRTSVMAYKGTRVSLPQIARELGVDAVVEGSALQSGDRVRVTAQLIDATSDRHLWARNYERGAEDVIALQRELALAIAQGVQATLTPGEQARLAARPSVDPRAYEAYLRGRFQWESMTSDGLKGAIEQYERAIALDPSYAPAYAGLAESYWIMGSAGYEVAPQGETAPKARAAARRALELEPGLGQAEAALGFIEIDFDWDFAKGEARVKEALARNPGLGAVHVSFSYYLAAMGRFDEAIAEAKHGQDLDPLSVVAAQTLGFRYYYARRYAEAETAFARALQLDPRTFVAHLGRGLVLWQTGQVEKALLELEGAVAGSGESPYALAALGHVSAASGHPVRAREILGRLEAEGAHRYLPGFYPAVVKAGLGDNTGALAGLEKAFAERSAWMVFLKVEPFFDGLRNDPRFADLLRRAGHHPTS